MLKIKFKWRSKIRPVFNPNRVWRWLMSVFLIMVAGALGGGYFSYRQLENIEIASQRRLQSQTNEPLRLDLKTLAEVRARLEAKAVRTAALKAGPAAIADPSL